MAAYEDDIDTDISMTGPPVAASLAVVGRRG